MTTPRATLLGPPVVVAFYGGAVLSAAAWIEIEPALAWATGRVPAPHLLHVVRLASVAALAVTLGAFALAALDRASHARGGRLAAVLAPCVLVTTLLFPALDAARLLAGGDGVPRGFAWAVIGVATATLAGSPTVFFLWWRADVRSPRWALPGIVAWLLLGACAPRMLATYAFLAPFVLGIATFVGGAVAAAALARSARARTVAVGLITTLGIAWSLPAARPRFGIEARRAFLLSEPSTTGLDVALFGALPGTAFARFPTGRLAPEMPCPTTRPAPWTTLPLPPERRRNVILVSIDALRRDAVDWRRGGRPVAPHIARFVRGSIAPKRAYTSYPATLFAMAGAATGLTPSRLLASPRPSPGLFRLLRGAVDDRHAILPDTGWFRAPALALALTQGAHAVFARDAAATTDALIHALSDARATNHSVFAWVHYGEPHEPYVEQEHFDFGPGLRERYASEVAHTDDQVGRLFAYLAGAGWREDSLIMVFADHGEALGERGRVGHHVSLNRWVMDVPLAFSVPAGASVATPDVASLLDIAPTALHFLGIAPPPYALDGRSLLARAADAAERAVTAEAFPLRGNDLWALMGVAPATPEDIAARLRRVATPAAQYAPKVALVRGARRLIVHRASGLVEMYDTRHDTSEAHDLSEREPATTRTLLDALANWHRDTAHAMRCEAARP